MNKWISKSLKNQNGYVSQAISQSLQFVDESNTILSVSGTTETDMIAPDGRAVIFPGDGGANQPNVGHLISKE